MYRLVIWLLLLGLNQPLLASRLPALSVESSDQVRLFNVRLREEAGVWLIKGRVTRSDKEQKVSGGRIVATLPKSEKVLAETRFNPQFLHRKTKRASYFTLRIKPRDGAAPETIRIHFQH